MKQSSRRIIGLFAGAAMATAWTGAQAADAKPADLAQADKFLADLPKSCSQSYKDVAADGTVNIHIKCDGNNKKLGGLVSVKDGVVTEMK